MPAVVRYPVDICSGHGCWPPRNNAQGSPDFFANGFQVHRQGDLWLPHCCFVCHDGVLSSGSTTVYANGKQVGRVGDPVSCGSFAATGSDDTFFGG